MLFIKTNKAACKNVQNDYNEWWSDFFQQIWVIWVFKSSTEISGEMKIK